MVPLELEVVTRKSIDSMFILLLSPSVRGERFVVQIPGLPAGVGSRIRRQLFSEKS